MSPEAADQDAAIYAQVEAAAAARGVDGPAPKDPADVPDIIRDEAEPEPKAKEPKPPEKREPEPPATGGPKPPAAEEPKPPEKPAEAAKPAPAEPVKPAWDPNRQRQDQEFANLRKSNDAIKAGNDALKAELGELRELVSKGTAQAAAAAKAPAATNAEKQVADDVAAVKAELGARIRTLGDAASAEDILAAMQDGFDKILDIRATTGADNREVAELRADLAALKADRDKRELDAATARHAAEQAKVDAEYDRHIAALKAEHGDHLYNDVLLAVGEAYRKAGISAENPPPLEYAKLLITHHYERLAREKPGRARQSAPKGKVPRLDSGTGGTPAHREITKRTGRLDEVLADMDREGKFAPGYEGEGG
ncbi:MAG: hypothetical protein FD189_1102 [Elusimicrobia bacterium]|nr:MAG: hypothetical protein FD189_1102 [Elusimicrobiota bacterium]